MSVLFDHACRYEFFDGNPIRLVRQSAKRRSPPAILTAAEIRTLLDGLKIRETEFKVMQELLRHSTIRSTLDVYTQAITPAKQNAQAAVMSLVFPSQ
jgi:site-specific recombinase XerD